MALFGRSCELSGIDHSGFGLESAPNAGFNNAYGIRGATKVNSTITTHWIGISSGLDGGPYAGTFWHRFFFGWPSGGNLDNGKILLEYSNNAGTPVFRLQATNGNAIQAQYWNGTAWTNAGATPGLSANSTWKCDLKIICGGSGSFEFYATNNMAVEPVLLLSGSAVMTLVTNLDAIKAYPTSGSTGNIASHSEWIWGDEPTTGHRIAWAAPTGDGTYVAGSGSYVDVDEAVTNDADLSTLAASGDAETYTHGAMTLPAGTVKAVFAEARVRNVATGAQNVKSRLRVGVVDYDATVNFAGIGTSFKPYAYRWATNPAGGAWTPATAGQISNEFGLLAQT